MNIEARQKVRILILLFIQNNGMRLSDFSINKQLNIWSILNIVDSTILNLIGKKGTTEGGQAFFLTDMHLCINALLIAQLFNFAIQSFS
jgi:hypothetical protein